MKLPKFYMNAGKKKRIETMATSEFFGTAIGGGAAGAAAFLATRNPALAERAAIIGGEIGGGTSLLSAAFRTWKRKRR